MYAGKRDAHLTIKVPMSLCFLITINNMDWIEIMVPPSLKENMTKPWLSMVVQPKQVFWLDDTFNLIENINANTCIKLCEHYTDEMGYRRIVPGTELFVNPQNIITNFENYNNSIKKSD